MEKLERRIEWLESRSRRLLGVEIGALMGIIVGIASYLTNQDPEATKTASDIINIIAEPIGRYAIGGYVSGLVYNALLRNRLSKRIKFITHYYVIGYPNESR